MITKCYKYSEHITHITGKKQKSKKMMVIIIIKIINNKGTATDSTIKYRKYTIQVVQHNIM